MRMIWFDTEFIEDGRTIDLLSIGLIREDGQEFYAEPQETDRQRANEWVMANVIPHLRGPLMPRAELVYQLREFCGEQPEFWAYYADYDWVALCQLFGRMIDLPRGWPMYCRDVKQLCDSVGNPKLPSQSSVEHNALNDARWTRDAWLFLDALEAPMDDARDAARYRWLRSFANFDRVDAMLSSMNYHTLDAAVDAAIAERTKEQQR